MVAADEGQIFTCGGQIVTGVTPYVRTTTEYLAALIAITRALRWATTYLGVHTLPVGAGGARAKTRQDVQDLLKTWLS